MPTSTPARSIPLRQKGCCESVALPLPLQDEEALATLFKALGDPTRVEMVHMLKATSTPICVCDFTAAFNLGQATVSHHLAKLRDAGVVTTFKQGVWNFYELASDLSPAMRSALELIP